MVNVNRVSTDALVGHTIRVVLHHSPCQMVQHFLSCDHWLRELKNHKNITQFVPCSFFCSGLILLATLTLMARRWWLPYSIEFEFESGEALRWPDARSRINSFLKLRMKNGRMKKTFQTDQKWIEFTRLISDTKLTFFGIWFDPNTHTHINTYTYTHKQNCNLVFRIALNAP